MSLTLTDLTLTYPDGDTRLVALDAVSLQVGPGELVAITGPSGSGKSTLLAVAGLLLRPEAGTVCLAGADTRDLSRREQTRLRRDTIGFVFQQSNLLASLTAFEQLQMVARIAGHRGAVSDARAADLLEAVGLHDAMGRRPHQLSGGQRQRVGIARALMNDPVVLLVDEPTSSLDAERGRVIVELLARVTHELQVATVMVTHDIAHLDVVDRHAEIHDGRLVEKCDRRLAAKMRNASFA